MCTGKKVLNVFGIIFAWLLSLVLVVLLVVSPVLLSGLSVAQPKNLMQTMTQMELPQLLEMLDAGVADPENPQVAAFAATDAAQQIYEIYVTGVFTSLDGGVPAQTLTEETIRQIVRSDMDNLYAIAVKDAPQLEQLPQEEAKPMVEDMLTAKLVELTEQLPAPESFTQTLADRQPELATALEALTQMGTVKLAYVGVLAVLSLLIFVCRLFGFRGFRWLSVDLFVASGLSGLVCVGLTLGTSAAEALFAESKLISLLAGSLLPGLVQGTYIRTGVMLLAAIALLVVYLLIRKNMRSKKNGNTPAPETMGQ